MTQYPSVYARIWTSYVDPAEQKPFIVFCGRGVYNHHRRCFIRGRLYLNWHVDHALMRIHCDDDRNLSAV